jgi:hypothetical protein
VVARSVHQPSWALEGGNSGAESRLLRGRCSRREPRDVGSGESASIIGPGTDGIKRICGELQHNVATPWVRYP